MMIMKLGPNNLIKVNVSRYQPDCAKIPDLLYNMGVVLLNQGHHDEALMYLDKALEHDPDHYQALLNSAILIQESGFTQLNKTAHSRLMRIVEKSTREST